MEFFLCRGFSGQIYRVNVNEYAPIAELMPVMAQSVGLYSMSDEDLGLYNLTRDKEYAVTDTLFDRGAKNGDLLILAEGGSCHKKE